MGMGRQFGDRRGAPPLTPYHRRRALAAIRGPRRYARRFGTLTVDICCVKGFVRDRLT